MVLVILWCACWNEYCFCFSCFSVLVDVVGIVRVFPFNTESFICWCCAIVTAVCLFIHFHLNRTTQSTQLDSHAQSLYFSHLALISFSASPPPSTIGEAASHIKSRCQHLWERIFSLFERPHRWLLFMRMDRRRYTANSVFPFQVPATYLSFNRNGMKLMKWHFYRKTVQTRTSNAPPPTAHAKFNQ